MAALQLVVMGKVGGFRPFFVRPLFGEHEPVYGFFEGGKPSHAISLLLMREEAIIGTSHWLHSVCVVEIFLDYIRQNAYFYSVIGSSLAYAARGAAVLLNGRVIS